MRKRQSTVPVDRGGRLLRDALTAGHSPDAIRRDVRAGRLDSPYRGVITPVGASTGVDRLRAAMLHAGAESVAIAGSACLLRGLQGLPLDALPEIALPPGLEKRQRAGIVLHFWDIHDCDRETVQGLVTTTALRTLADVCRLMPRFRAVSLVDSALHLGVIQVSDLDHVAHHMSRRRNCVTGRRTLRLARFGAQSPLETRVRLIATDSGLPPDELQVPVTDRDGTLLGYADLGYHLPGGGLLAVEADGAGVHSLPDALLHDRRRQNAFQSYAGVTVVRFTWADTRTPAYVPSVLRPLLSAAGWTPRRRP